MNNTPAVTKKNGLFRMECGVRVSINAPASRVWSLLTNAGDFARWNSTVTSIEGEIALGKPLKVKVPISTRTFTPKVTALEPNTRMVWSDGMLPFFKGVRTFTLTPSGDATEFTMVEVFQGMMLPMIKGALPDFGPPFERYALDLKQEAEKGA